jgi:hypothetical protein
MVLYKHGVGYIERKGTIKDQKEIKLSFKKDMMNDILKSLLVSSSGEGMVTGVSYETPEDISKILDEKAIRVPEREAMIGIFRQLKGYTIEIETNTDKQKGKVLGTQEYSKVILNESKTDISKDEGKDAVVIKDDSGAIKNIPLEKIVSYRIENPEATEDLDFFLDAVTSERKKNVRGVTIFLDGKEHDLNISYIQQIPSWRVSYRLVHEKGKALMQGWGIIDNNLDEDLKDVTVSLVAGKPISFIYDLYTPPEIYRPLIKEEYRGVSTPIELEERAMEAELELERPKSFACDAIDSHYQIARRESQKEMIAGSTSVKTKTVEMGEFFKYDIQAPVTIKRGQSAMVPIIQKEIDCIKEHIYNAEKMARNPLVAMRVKNDTGMVLERGPVVVVDDTTYVGEAIMPYTTPNGENHIAYSVDMGIIITKDSQIKSEFREIYIRDDFMYLNKFETIITEYDIENKNKEDVELIIEHPKKTPYELVDTAKPMEETENFYRWKSSLKAKSKTKFTSIEGKTITTAEDILKVDLNEVDKYLNPEIMDEKTLRFLMESFEQRIKVKDFDEKINSLDNESNQIYQEQKRIRENLRALSTSGEEEKMRLKYIKSLERKEERLDKIKKEQNELKKKRNSLNAKIKSQISKWKNTDS